MPFTLALTFTPPRTSLTMSVNCGIKPTGMLSDTSVAEIGRSSRREPVTPLKARSIGTVPSRRASVRPVESNTPAFVVSCLFAYEKVP